MASLASSARAASRRALPVAAALTLALAAPPAHARRPPPPTPEPPDPPAVAPPVSIQQAAAVLFDGEVPAACAALLAGATAPEQVTRAVVECMLGERYRKDHRARATALALYRQAGSVAGVGQAETMDGGYRGQIRLVPQLPTGAHRVHLTRVAAAMADFDRVLGELAVGAKVAPALRWRNLLVRFVRSVGKRTPSAYAADWTVTYNVAGSLLGSEEGVRDTLWHEIFHVNDEAHDDWSPRALGKDYDAIVARCSPALTRACLAPYAPGTTTVRGGTYYAFQQNNGTTVHEYAAELALRYYREHRELRTKGKLSRPPFKCGAPENARAWRALVDEFFAGIDQTPACN